jgi:hypothetical protein
MLPQLLYAPDQAAHRHPAPPRKTAHDNHLKQVISHIASEFDS